MENSEEKKSLVVMCVFKFDFLNKINFLFIFVDEYMYWSRLRRLPLSFWLTSTSFFLLHLICWFNGNRKIRTSKLEYISKKTTKN